MTGAWLTVGWPHGQRDVAGGAAAAAVADRYGERARTRLTGGDREGRAGHIGWR